MKTINKKWVSNRIKQGKILVKCSLHLTDDYQFDNANNFGEGKEWKKAYFGDPGDHKHNEVNLYHDDFRCYGDKNGIFTIRIHSNLSYQAKLEEIK